jgi:hypothetical protein
MSRGEVRRGRAGQAFDFGEPGVLDGATAKSLAAGRHGPRQGGVSWRVLFLWRDLYPVVPWLARLCEALTSLPERIMHMLEPQPGSNPGMLDQRLPHCIPAMPRKDRNY